MDGFQRLPLDTLKLLFSKIDISITVSCIEAVYANSGRGRPRYPVRSMLLALLFMRFEAIPSVRKLCRRCPRCKAKIWFNSEDEFEEGMKKPFLTCPICFAPYKINLDEEEK